MSSPSDLDKKAGKIRRPENDMNRESLPAKGSKRKKKKKEKERVKERFITKRLLFFET